MLQVKIQNIQNILRILTKQASWFKSSDSTAELTLPSASQMHLRIPEDQ